MELGKSENCNLGKKALPKANSYGTQPKFSGMILIWDTVQSSLKQHLHLQYCFPVWILGHLAALKSVGSHDLHLKFYSLKHL